MAADPMAPFARALADGAAGRRARLVFRYEDGRSDTVDAAPFVRPFLFPPIERKLLERLEAEVVPGARLLDVGCGAGRHARNLAERGFAVDALDSSPSVAMIARHLGCPAREATLWDLPADIPYDGALIMGNSIGLVGAVHALGPFLARLRQLTPFAVADSIEPVGPEQVRVRLEYGDLVGAWFDWLHPGKQTLTRVAAQAGWEITLIELENEPRYGALFRRPA